MTDKKFDNVDGLVAIMSDMHPDHWAIEAWDSRATLLALVKLEARRARRRIEAEKYYQQPKYVGIDKGRP